MDNVVLNQNTTTGATIATDDIAGIQHQLVKIEYGDPDSATQVSATNRLPVATGLTQPTTPADTQPISAASLPLPTGAATAANQTTGNTSLGTIAGAVSGTEMQVDVLTLPATPTGDNTIGRVKITDGTDVADVLDLTNSNPIAAAIVDANGDQITSFGGGTQYADGAVRGTATGTLAMGDDGVNIQSVHVDSAGDLQVDVLTMPTTTVQATNLDIRDLTFAADKVDASGSVLGAGDNNIGNVDIVSSALPTGASTLAEQQTQTTALQLIDDTVATDGAATPTKGILMAGQDGTNAQTVKTDTDGNLQIDVLTMPTTTVTATDLDIRDLVFATDKVDASGTVLGAGDNNIGNVDVVSSALPTGASTLAEQQTQTTALQIMDDWDNAASDGASVSGDVAHDSPDAGEPVKVGGKALDLGATPTAVAANDRTNAAFMRNGVQFVLGGHPNIITQNVQITDADGAQTDLSLVGTIAAGTSVVVTKCSVTADNANTVDVSVRVGFGATNTPAADAAGVILFHPGIAAGSGIVEGSGAGIIGIGASGEELRMTCEDPVTGSISVIITYFTIAIG